MSPTPKTKTALSQKLVCAAVGDSNGAKKVLQGLSDGTI